MIKGTIHREDRHQENRHQKPLNTYQQRNKDKAKIRRNIRENKKIYNHSETY